MLTTPRKLGWLKDFHDPRDYSSDSPQIKAILDRSAPLAAAAKAMATSIDLRPKCTPILDQGDLGSCTANAAAGMVSYYQQNTFGKYIPPSRLFTYKLSRRLDGLTGDSGAYLRTTMQALALFGVPSEVYWPYNIATFDNDPDGFLYEMASNYKATKYYRLDPIGASYAMALTNIKTKIQAGLPCMFGMTVFSSFPVTVGTGDIPYPTRYDSVWGGHALVVVGYNDARKIGADTGALLVRNSWGTSWGDRGYGWLPYRYVTTGLASDFWSMASETFIDTSLFQ